MKSTYTLALLAATSALLVTSAPLRASDTDSRIESSAAKSYVFKTYLKDDSIKTESKDGVVTLTGTVTKASDKSLAQDTVASLPGVISVNNQLLVTGEQPAEHSDTWIGLKVKSALLFHRNVSATGTKVYVKMESSPCRVKPPAWLKRNSPPNTPRTLTMSNRSRMR